MKGDIADDLAWPFEVISGTVNGFTACITDELTRCLQSVQNTAARLLTGTRRCDNLACAPPAALASCAAVRRVQAQNLYRRRLWKFCSSRLRLSSTGPCPATPWATWQTTVSSSLTSTGVRQLRSADTQTLVASRTRSSFGDMTFTAAGPQVWNSLPLNLILCGLGYHTASSCGYWRHSDSEDMAQCELFLTASDRNILTYLII